MVSNGTPDSMTGVQLIRGLCACLPKVHVAFFFLNLVRHGVHFMALGKRTYLLGNKNR